MVTPSRWYTYDVMSVHVPLSRISARRGRACWGKVTACDGDCIPSGARLKPPLDTTVPAGTWAVPDPDRASGAREKLPGPAAWTIGVNTHAVAAHPVSLVLVAVVAVNVWMPAARLEVKHESHALTMLVPCRWLFVTPAGSVHADDVDTEYRFWYMSTARSRSFVPDGVDTGNDVAAVPEFVPGVPLSMATVPAGGRYSCMHPRIGFDPEVNVAPVMPPGLPPVSPSPRGLYIHVSVCAVPAPPTAWVAIFAHPAGPVAAVRELMAISATSSVPGADAAGRRQGRLPEPVVAMAPFCRRVNPATVHDADRARGARANDPAAPTPMTKLLRVICPSKPCPSSGFPAPAPPPPPPGPVTGGDPILFTPPPLPPGPPPVTAVAPAPATVPEAFPPAFPAAAVPPDPPPPPPAPPAPPPAPPAPPLLCVVFVLPNPPVPPADCDVATLPP